ncbi:MAG TPA: glycosyltransferase family 4 protein, partial [Myxococcota bacterium]
MSAPGPMRVALVIERFEPGIGGVENVAWRLAEGLAQAGDEVHVVARRAQSRPEVALHLVNVPAFWQPLRVAAFSRAAARAAPRGDYDVVYSLSRTLHQDLYRAGAGSHLDYLRHRYATPARQLRRLSPRHALLAGFDRRVFEDASQRVVCNSELVRNEIAQRYRVEPARLVLIRNGVAFERFAGGGRERARVRSELAGGSDSVFVLAGSGFARKGLDTALRALARARVPAQLWVAGADDTTPWQRRARALGVAERVRFVGYRRDLPAVFAAADALLLPTRYDAFANVCLEAA